MAAQQTVYSETMVLNAVQWLRSAPTWTRGTRKADGLAVVIFPSASKPGTGHYATATACSCQSFQHRQECSHVLAVKIDVKQARERAIREHDAACMAAVSDPALGLVEAY